MEKINTFKKDYAFLSNFSYCTIKYNGFTFPTLEHAYQAAKATNKEEQKQFTLATLKPGEAKSLGRAISVRDDWNEVKLGIMYELVKQKFSNPRLKQKLLDTGEIFLEEGNYWHDNYWGNCYCNDCQSKKGENKLGRILMLVRQESRR